MSHSVYQPRGEALDADDREFLAVLAVELGDVEAARRLGFSVQTLCKGIAGRPVLAGTRAQVREYRRTQAA